MSIRRALPACLIAVAVAALALAPGASAAPPAATAGKTYVAMGDSYAAGFGLPLPSTPTGQPVPGCAQTTLDYPRQVAANLGLQITDVTCSGATTTDFYSPQNVTGPRPPAQLDVFKTVQPDLITITIGGNDLGFTTIARTCLAASDKGPIYSNVNYSSCQAYYQSSAGQSSNPYNLLTSVAAKVKQAIAAVQAAAPKAKIVVIAYPAIAPDTANTPTGGCFNANLLPNGPVTVGGIPLVSAFPFTNVDLPFLQVLQQNLDNLIGQAAIDLGATYADIYPSSLSHSACSPEAVRWVEPVVPGGGGTNVLHPSLAGTTAMAALVGPLATALLTPAPAQSGQSAQGNGTAVAVQTVPVVVPTLANTGPVPVWPLLALAALLLVSGAAILGSPLARRAAADPNT